MVKTNYKDNIIINRKIDQAYEMASLALQDGDKTDAARWYNEAKRLKESLS